MPMTGEGFIHHYNSRLHTSPEVEHVVGYLKSHNRRLKLPNNPEPKISAYLEFLGDKKYVNDGILTFDTDSIEHQAEVRSIEMTQDNIDRYAALQDENARAMGELPETRPHKEKYAALMSVHIDQKTQLTEWGLALNGYGYPNWFKYWMFENVKRHTDFNADLDKNGRPRGFEPRSNSSFAAFPELNHASIAIVYDVLEAKMEDRPVSEKYEAMEPLLAKAKFSELYAAAQEYGQFIITDRHKEVETGSWHRFEKSEDPFNLAAQSLAQAARSYRTSWCILGTETAKSTLADGDMHLWMSTDPDTLEDAVPRIGIRIKGGKVFEVRGVEGGRRQELETKLIDTVLEKLMELPGGEKYTKNADDMKQLATLEHHITDNPDADLSEDEVRFLYEIDTNIEGFGHERDPRIDLLRAVRDGLDKEILTGILQQDIAKQVRGSFGAFSRVEDIIGGKLGRVARRLRGEYARQSPEEIMQIFKEKSRDWQERGLYDYMAEQLITKGIRYSLVMTPNRVVKKPKIVEVAEKFDPAPGMSFRISNAIDYDLYVSAWNKSYSSEALSAPQGDEPIRWSFIPDIPKNSQYGDRVEPQVQMLQNLQKQSPNLGLHVPSVLEAISYWYAVIAHTNTRMSSKAFTELTEIRHFDMEPQELRQETIVPRSRLVFSEGRLVPALDRVAIDKAMPARIALS